MTTMGCFSRLGFMMAMALLSIPFARWLHLSSVMSGLLLMVAFFTPFICELAVLFVGDLLCGPNQVTNHAEHGELNEDGSSRIDRTPK